MRLRTSAGMSITVEVKSKNEAARIQREKAAQRVVSHFGLCLPTSRVLCFLDDEDPSSLKQAFGATNRGLSGTIKDGDDLSVWPDYVRKCMHVDHDVYPYTRRVIDQLIYLHGSTCNDEVGLTMTLAHELQHAIQHDKVRKVWAVNSLIRHLPTAVDDLKLEWADIPIERDARTVAKRVALDLYGEQPVREYIHKRSAEAVEPHDVADWHFVRGLTPSSSVDLVGDTHGLFHRLKDYRHEVEGALRERQNDSDFSDVNLDEFFNSSL
jgi:hypothetical protein